MTAIAQRNEHKGWHWGRSIAAAGALAAVALLVALSVGAHQAAYFPIDLATTQAFQRLQSPALDAVALAIDWLGYVPQIFILVALTAVWLWVAGRRWEGVLLLFGLGAEGTAAATIKLLVQRPRPDVAGIHIYQPLGDNTYPSGHVFCYVVVCGLLIYYALRFLGPSWWRTAGCLVLIALALAVGPVRVYLGEHWLSDVAAGYLLGALGLPVLIWLHRRGERWLAQRASH